MIRMRDSNSPGSSPGSPEASASREDAPEQLDGSDAPEGRAELGGASEGRPRVVRRSKTREWVRGLPVISEERVRELAARGTSVDGFEDNRNWTNAKVMKYARESPPMSPEVRAVLEAFPMVEQPADPGIYCLWERDRIVFVGKSRSGIMGAHLAASLEVGSRNRASQVKDFDRLAFKRCPEEWLDLAVGALCRMLRPKYNRKVPWRDPAEDEPILRFLGFAPSVRAA